MSPDEIFTNCASRFKSLTIPTELERIAVIETPFLRIDKPVLLGKRHKGHLLALFPCSVEELRKLEKPQKLTNGFRISRESLIDPASGHESYFLELSNIENIDVALFGALLDEILRSVEQNEEAIEIQIRKLLDKWRNLLNLDSERQMTGNALLGLYGELVVFEHLSKLYGPAIFDNWVGPLGNRHDFEFNANSLEIKTTSIKDNYAIQVNGIYQLEAFEGKKVTILRIVVEVDPLGESVPKLVERIVANNLVSEFTFFEKLIKVGYRKEHEQNYQHIGFQVTSIKVIDVDDNFPRIKKADLIMIDPENRIHEISYSVNIAGLERQNAIKLDEIAFGELIK